MNPTKRRPARIQNFLEPLKGDKPKRKKFLTLDIESKHNDSDRAGFTRPFLVGVHDPEDGVFECWRDEKHLINRYWQARHYSNGGCVDKALEYILAPRFAGRTIYAHNGGNFDYLFLLRWLRIHNDAYMFDVVPVQSSIQALRVWKVSENPDDEVKDVWTFLDSVKLLPMSLQKACESFKVPGKLEHDLNMPESDPRWEAYLEQDCRALSEVMNAAFFMIEDRLGGEVGMTGPSTSMKLFRKRFLGRGSSPRKVTRYQHWQQCADRETCPGCFHAWVRRGYYGGRTELFQTYGRDLHYFDINSSYVAAMREDMPIESRIEMSSIDWSYYGDKSGFAEVDVFIPQECEIPPLPHKSQKTRKLMFPTGRFRGVWSLEELRLLSHERVNGKILKVHRCVWFQKRPMFTEMVDTLWTMRNKNLSDYDEGLSMMAKLMGNALYGKFGMAHERTSITFAKAVSLEACFLCQKTIASGLGICNDCEGSKSATGDPDSDVWYQNHHVDAPYIIPHIAAHITALARVRLWRFMIQALEMGGKIWYADTDSILTDVVLPSSSDLGGLKDEYPGQLLEGTFVQPKVYMVEGQKPDGEKWSKVTMKGFGKDMRTKENLARLRKGETLSFDRLEKVRTLARLGFSRSPSMADVTKSFKSSYDKRIINDDGITTRPVYIDELEG